MDLLGQSRSAEMGGSLLSEMDREGQLAFPAQLLRSQPALDWVCICLHQPTWIYCRASCGGMPTGSRTISSALTAGSWATASHSQPESASFQVSMLGSGTSDVTHWDHMVVLFSAEAAIATCCRLLESIAAHQESKVLPQWPDIQMGSVGCWETGSRASREVREEVLGLLPSIPTSSACLVARTRASIPRPE